MGLGGEQSLTPYESRLHVCCCGKPGNRLREERISEGGISVRKVACAQDGGNEGTGEKAVITSNARRTIV